MKKADRTITPLAGRVIAMWEQLTPHQQDEFNRAFARARETDPLTRALYLEHTDPARPPLIWLYANVYSRVRVG
jgi:hypothetical protein